MIRQFGLLLTLGIAGLVCHDLLLSQELPLITTTSAVDPARTDQPGVEVQARGPIHEAFATPSGQPVPTHVVPKRPPSPLEEMPPEERPEGDAVWLGGYWAWDDDRNDHLWVSGCWRVKPDGKDWVPGYWREAAGQWQWVPGFWNTVHEQKTSAVTYYPEPPAPPQLALPAPPPEPDMFYVPGYWMWTGDHYVWRAGYHTRVRRGHVYVASHYRWTPFGFVFVSGYWDFAVARRGVLYAPVYVDTVVVGPRFVYTPYYAVSDSIMIDAFFVRPGHCHYYFGDYYGPRYASMGFECGFHYSRRHYDPIISYSRWEYRDSPGWYDTRLSITIARNSGRAPLPPRTLIQQNNVHVTNVTNIKNVTINNNSNVSKTMVLAPAKTVVAARGAKTVAVDATARLQVKESSLALQKAAINERSKAEFTPHGSVPSAKPRTANLSLPSSPGPVKTLGGTGSGPKKLDLPATTTLPKKLDAKGTPEKQPLTTKETTPKAAPVPIVTKQPPPPPAKKPAAEPKKKKG